MFSTTAQIAAIFQRVYEGTSLPSDWETYVGLIAKVGGHAEMNEENYAFGSKKFALQMYAQQVLKIDTGATTEEMKRLATMYLRDNPVQKKEYVPEICGIRHFGVGGGLGPL